MVQVNVTPSALNSFIGANNARLTQLAVSTAPTLANPTPSFSAILVGEQRGCWWWYYNQTLAGVVAHADQNGARVTDLKQYADAQGNTLYACIMADNANAITQRVRQLFWNALPNGDFGLYLRQVDGPVLANLNENFTFEPASMIKILHGTYAVAQCTSNADSLDNTLFNDDTCHPGECPDPVGCNSSTESLAAVLRRMLQASDNNATKEVADRYGVSNLNDFALSLGLTSTQLNHTLGCLCGNPNNHFSLSTPARFTRTSPTVPSLIRRGRTSSLVFLFRRIRS